MTDSIARARVLLDRSEDAHRWRVDWARVIDNLQAKGLSLQAVADQVRIGKSTLQAYITDDCRSEPQFWVGNRIIALWCEVTGYTVADLPKWRRPLSVSEILRAHQ